ncbi:MAG: 30S ribosomal protein S16 [Armatimonadetes bacterium]|nr:30S ribosomal protein S16 [Armatimonadota bacterium]
MAVRIRLRRIGKKKQPQYRLVVAESAGPRDGRFIESIGQYNPRVDPAAISVNEERALHWLQHGAQPSETAQSILVKAGVWEKFTGDPPAPTPEPPAVVRDEAAPEESTVVETEVAESAVEEPAEDEAAGTDEEVAAEAAQEKAGESADENPA